jgi:hypothetical protein
MEREASNVQKRALSPDSFCTPLSIDKGTLIMKINFVFALMMAAVFPASAFAKDGNRVEGSALTSAVTEQKIAPMETERLQNSAPSSHHSQSGATPFGGWDEHHKQQLSNDVNKMENTSTSYDIAPIHHARSQNIPLGGWSEHHQQRISNDINKIENTSANYDASPVHHARSQNIPWGGWAKHHQQ